MTTEQSQPSNEGTTAVVSLIDALAMAIRRKDVDAVMSVFSPDVVSFDLGPPLRHGGGSAFEERWRALFDAYQGSIDFEPHDLRISASNDLAFSHSLNRMRGTTKSGVTTDRWSRWTACYRKTNGKWLIVHEQVSVPIDMKSGRALLELTPEAAGSPPQRAPG